MPMTKAELIRTIAKSADINLSDAEEAINSLVDLIVDEVQTVGKFALANIGVFTRVQRSARNARNPQTGEPVKVEAKTTVKFRPAASFKAALNP